MRRTWPRPFPGCEVAATAAFRITRDADVVLQDDEEIDDLLHAMEEVVLSRRRRDARAADDFRPARSAAEKWLADWLKLDDEEVYEVDGPQEAVGADGNCRAGRGSTS